jgi:hypothetical protein
VTTKAPNSKLSYAAGGPPKETDRTRAKPVNHNKRAKEWLKADGAVWVETMEHEQAFSVRKKDFLACDFMAIYKDHLALVQLTTDSNKGARRKKMLANPGLGHWALAGGRVLLLTYKKSVSAGGAISYTPSVEDLTGEWL